MYPDPLFHIFNIEVDLYTIFFLVGIIACFIFTFFAMKKSAYSPSASDTILVIGIFSIMFGLLFAVLFQSFYDFLAFPSGGFKITGKMTFLGGLLGGVITFLGLYFLYVYVINPRLKERNFFKSNMNKGLWELLRFAPISITIAHAFGRIGCFFAGCCGGKETDAWFGVTFPGELVKVIPTQLFEAIFLFLISAAMIVLYFVFKFKYNMSVYLIGYGVWRFIIEFFRDDDRGSFMPGLSPSQFWAIIMVIGGVIFFFLYRYFDKIITYEKEQKLKENKEIEKSHS